MGLRIRSRVANSRKYFGMELGYELAKRLNVIWFRRFWVPIQFFNRRIEEKKVHDDK